MTEVTIYTTPVCPYCVRAKDLLKRKGFTNIKEIDVSANDSLREEMMQKSGGRRTVPQIFIDENHVGGSDDLYELEKQGKLSAMLGISA